MSRRRVFALLALVAVTLTLTPTICPSEALNASSRWVEVYRLYEWLVELYRRGGEVSNATAVLAEAVELLEMCETSQCLSRVDQLLNTTAKLLDEAEEALPRVQAIRTLSLAAKAAVLLSLPVAAYILLPRLVAWEWYFTRRRWLVVGRRKKRREER